jgi:hypothetical protein
MAVGPNRVIVGLPARLEKAKRAIAVLERRIDEILEWANDPLVSDEDFRRLTTEALGVPLGDDDGV